MNRNPVNWFEIYVDDMARAKSFYQQVLGVSLQRLDMPDVEMWTFPMVEDAPGAAGSLVRMPGVSAGGFSTLVYFSCEDCSVEASRVTRAGGKLERDKMSIGEYGFVAIAMDTEGNRFGLHSMK